MNGESSYRRFIEGDENAAREIIKEYKESLIFFIYRYVKNETIAEDIAIDVFAELFTLKRKYNYKSSLKTYLFIIAKSKALNYIRRSKTIVFTELTGLEADNALTPESHILKDEQNYAIHSAISSLPEDMQRAVHLVYFENMSYEQTAKIMRKNKKQIDNLLYRAKNILRTLLDGEFKL